MGTYINFNLSVPKGKEHLIKLLRSVNEDAHDAFDDEGYSTNDVSWYEVESDMRIFSLGHPDVLFTLASESGMQDGYLITYYKNGFSQECVGEIVYPDLNLELLERGNTKFDPSKHFKLNSVGAILDHNGNTYAQNLNGTFDAIESVHLRDCTDEWYSSLDEADRKLVTHETIKLLREKKVS